MQTHFVFRQMDSSSSLRSYAEDRLSKIKRYFSEPLKVNCTLSIEKIHHVAQFDVTLRNGLQLHSSEKTENMYSSIDMALAKMERQVRRYKDRITSHKPHKGKSAKIRQRMLSGESIDGVLAAEEIEAKPAPAPKDAPMTIVRESEFHAERLSVEQALMQMNLLHKSFYVFTNAETDDINVVYRHESGNYGLIETQGHVDDPGN